MDLEAERERISGRILVQSSTPALELAELALKLGPRLRLHALVLLPVEVPQSTAVGLPGLAFPVVKLTEFVGVVDDRGHASRLLACFHGRRLPPAARI
jgi:hypothetical protein